MEESLESVFRAYDIRGESPEQIDEGFARRLAVACVRAFAPSNVCVGRDMRTTSVGVEKALIDAFLEQGVNVTRIGLCSTPMFNVTVGLANGMFDVGVMVTASHNPARFNGFKFIRGDVSPIGQGSGMEELKDAFFTEGGDVPRTGRRGKLEEDRNALGAYVSHVIRLASLPPEMPKMRVAIDAGNGMAGVVLPELVSRLPWLSVQPLYFELDGTFPNHEANPLKSETLEDLRELMSAGGFDCGFAFDGDADRIGILDENGNAIPGDIGTALIAKEMLASAKGGEVLFDIRSSWSVPEAIEAAGGKATMCRVGHSFIKRQMRESGAMFGGEVSMHYYYSKLFNVESGDLTLLLLLKLIATSGKSLSGLWGGISEYSHSGEINFRAKDPDGAIARVAEGYRGTATAVIEIDGVRMEFRDPEDPENDWWFSLRPSNTEPLIRLNLETRSSVKTRERVKELSSKIRRA